MGQNQFIQRLLIDGLQNVGHRGQPPLFTAPQPHHTIDREWGESGPLVF